jgi:hypothetical protein
MSDTLLLWGALQVEGRPERGLIRALQRVPLVSAHSASSRHLPPLIQWLERLQTDWLLDDEPRKRETTNGQ